MQANQADLSFFADLDALNHAFIDLLIAPGCVRAASGLGLHPAIIEQLRRLSSAERDFIAASPGLLACFEPAADRQNLLIEDSARPVDVSVNEWRTSARLFVAGLLTWMGRLEAQHQPFCACSTVVDTCDPRGRGLFDLRHIGASADYAVRRLRARFTQHPHFWSDMIRSARSENEELRALTQMTVIPFVFAEACPAVR